MAENTPREVYGPNPDVAARSHIGSMEEYQRLYRLSLDDPETFWAKEAETHHLVPPLAPGLRQRLRERGLRLVHRAAA